MRQKTCWFPLRTAPRYVAPRRDLLRRAPTIDPPHPLPPSWKGAPSAGAARSYRDSDRWISSIICGGISRDCEATVTLVGVVNCIQKAVEYLIVPGPSYLRTDALFITAPIEICIRRALLTSRRFRVITVPLYIKRFRETRKSSIARHFDRLINLNFCASN